MSAWQSNIINYDLLSKEKLEFVFEQCKQCHLNTLENKKQLEQKSLAIIGVLVTVSTAIVGFLATHLNFKKPLNEQDWALIIPALVLIIVFYAASHHILNALRPVKYYPPGNEPQYLLSSEQFDQPFRWMLFSEVHNMQERITENDALNQKKADAVQKALFLIALAPLASATLFALIKTSPAILNILALWIGRFS